MYVVLTSGDILKFSISSSAIMYDIIDIESNIFDTLLEVLVSIWMLFGFVLVLACCSVL